MAGSIQSRIAELTRLNESREQFINNLSHELRTPITAVAGYAELLKIGSISDEERERSIGYIADQIRRIQQMSQKLMALTQIPFCAIQKQWVSLESAAANAAMTCAEQLNKKVIGLNMDLQAVNAYGDAVLIESLLQNLLENAVKASQQGGVVTISSRLIEESGDCVLWVADNGRGMASEEIAKVTEPFYRIDKARARKDGGAGLGLALCAKICDVHSAKMEIFSEPEKGAAIEITFYNTVTTS
jgi:signal transduction histidine kinase